MSLCQERALFLTGQRCTEILKAERREPQDRAKVAEDFIDSRCIEEM